jgi:multidrug efflux system membrane fusion protein
MSNESSPNNYRTETNPQDAQQPKNVWVRVTAYAVLAGLLGLGGWRIYQNHQKASAASAQQQNALLSRPVPVQVLPVEQRPMPIYLSAIGTVTPYMSVTVKARVSGQLLPVHFTEGQDVRQGQTILNVDSAPYKAVLEQAKGTLAHDQALLKNAQAQFNRYKALFEAGVVSKESMETQQAALGQYQGAIEADKAAVETAELQLSWCSIQSPIAGKIGLRLVDPGNIITANTTNLVVINQFKPIAVYFTLPETQLPQVLGKLASERKLAVQAYDQGGSQLLATGQLLTADNQIDTTTGTAKLKAIFDNHDNKLFPNQFVNIRLVVENRPNALLVPSAAIQTGQQGNFVWVVSTDANGKSAAQQKPVQISLAQGQNTILDGGVNPGEQVVVDGADRVRTGSQVIVSAGHKSGSAAAGSTVQPAAATAAPSGFGHGFQQQPAAAPAAANPQGQHRTNKEQQ